MPLKDKFQLEIYNIIISANHFGIWLDILNIKRKKITFFDFTTKSASI
jgi:hypothetical protein